MGQNITTEQLEELSPLDGLKQDNLTALAKKTELLTAQPGHVLFRQGDTKKLTVYVLEGDVELEHDGEVVSTVTGGSRRRRTLCLRNFPASVRATAKSAIQYISLDSDLLDVMLTWDQTGSYEVGSLGRKLEESSDDWMTTLLQTKAFHKIPPANIQAIFMRLQQVNVKSGDTIVNRATKVITSTSSLGATVSSRVKRR